MKKNKCATLFKSAVLMAGLTVLASQVVAEERFFFDMPRDWALLEDIKDPDYQEMVFVPFSERESSSVSQSIRKITINKSKFDASHSLNGRVEKMTAACDHAEVLLLPSLTQEDSLGYSHEGAMFWCVDKAREERSIGAMKQVSASNHVFILERIWRDNTIELPSKSLVASKKSTILDSYQWAVVCDDAKQAGSCNKMQEDYMAASKGIHGNKHNGSPLFNN